MKGQRVLCLVAPFAPAKLWPNSSARNWKSKVKPRRQYRGLVARLAEAALVGIPPKLKRSVIVCTFYYPHEQYFHDKDNCNASMKAAFDGLKDAGIIADDKYVTHETHRIAITDAPRNVQIEVFVEIP